MASLGYLWSNGRAVLRARWYLRHTTLGAKVRVWGAPNIQNSGEMIIRDRVRISSTLSTTQLAATENGLLEIGESTFINHGTLICATQLVRIGAHCSIGPGSIIMDSDFHRLEPERRDEPAESRPIVLEDNVWLGARVIVLRGVTIGSGSVIGAGSVVTRDVPPRSVAAGLPARIVRTL